MGELTLSLNEDFAECVVRMNPELVVSWFRLLPGSSNEEKLVRHQDGRLSFCHGRWLAQATDWAPQYDYPGVRTFILRFLIKNRIVNIPDAPPLGLAQPAWFNATDARDPAAPAAVVANDLGFCLARSDWGTVRTLILSAEDSPAEASAAQKLIPLIGGCIPTGVKLTLARPRLRAILEEVAYHAAGGLTVQQISSASFPHPGRY
jgi:hypothetical protein